jgi:hypothetical protein
MLRPTRALSFAALLLGAACSSTPPPMSPASPPPGAAARVDDAAKGAAVAAPAQAVVITAGAMPGDVQFYAELVGIREAFEATRASMGVPAGSSMSALLAQAMELDAALTERLLGALASVHLGGRRSGNDAKAAISMAFTDAGPLRELIASGKLLDAGPQGSAGRVLQPSGEKKQGNDALVWFEGPKLLVLGDPPMIEDVSAVVEGRKPGLTDEARKAALAAAGDHGLLRAFIAPALLDQLAAGRVSFPGPLSIGYDSKQGDLRGAYRASIAVRDVKANVPLPPQRALALAARLPAETAGYFALSTGIPGGPQGASLLLAQIGAILGQDAAGEGVLAAVIRPGVKTQAELEKGYAVVLVLEIADPKPIDSLMTITRKVLATEGKKKMKVHEEKGGFSLDLIGAPVPFVRVKLGEGRLFISGGPKDLVERASAAIDQGKNTLGADGAHAHALAGLPSSAQMRLWVDASRALQLATAVAPASDRLIFGGWKPGATGAARLTTGLSFSLTPEDDRVRLSLDEVNGVGVFAALGIYGVRRYLASAKGAEAKNMVGAISRGAVAAYEREQMSARGSGVAHALCKSAVPVPAAVPRGTKYMASSTPGADWDSGDAASGWRCLKISLSTPQYYRYSYSFGGPYKGPARGGPDPGPNGFEVAAEGDLDGDGVTSLFTRTGVIDPKTQSVKMAPEIFIVDELE